MNIRSDSTGVHACMGDTRRRDSRIVFEPERECVREIVIPREKIPVHGRCSVRWTMKVDGITFERNSLSVSLGLCHVQIVVLRQVRIGQKCPVHI